MDPNYAPPQWLWLPCIHTMSHSFMMAPMDPSNTPYSLIMAPMDPHYVPLIYDGSRGYLQYAPLIDDVSHGSALFTNHLWCLPWLPPIRPSSIMMDPSWLKWSLLHTWPTTQLGNFSWSLFDDILTPPLFNLKCDHLLIEVGKFSYLYTHVDKCLLQGFKR